MKKVKLKWSTVKYWIVLNIGILLMAVGTYFFKAPNNFATGGISGLAIILCKFTEPKVSWLGQTELTAFMNVLLLIIGFIFLGKGCSLKTAYCTLVYSGEMQLMKVFFHKTLTLPLTDQLFLEFVIAMLLTGAGSAIIFNCKASSGGTDILALIVKKYTPLQDVGKALIVTDFAIAFSAFFVFTDSPVYGLFSVLGLFTKAFLIDGVIESIVKSKYMMIITSHPETVAPFILDGLHRSFTSFKAQGGYTGEEKTGFLSCATVIISTTI